MLVFTLHDNDLFSNFRLSLSLSFFLPIFYCFMLREENFHFSFVENIIDGVTRFQKRLNFFKRINSGSTLLFCFFHVQYFLMERLFPFNWLEFSQVAWHRRRTFLASSSTGERVFKLLVVNFPLFLGAILSFRCCGNYNRFDDKNGFLNNVAVLINTVGFSS